MQETRVWSMGWEDPLEREMARHSSILDWKILWREEPDRLQFMVSQRVGHDEVTLLHFTPPRYRWDTYSWGSCWYQEHWDPVAATSKAPLGMGFNFWQLPCLLMPQAHIPKPITLYSHRFINWGLQEQVKEPQSLAALPWGQQSQPRTGWSIAEQTGSGDVCGEQGPLEGSRVLQKGAETPKRGCLWAVPLKETQGGNTHFYGAWNQN